MKIPTQRQYIRFTLPTATFEALQSIARRKACRFDEIFQEAVETYLEHKGYEHPRFVGADVTMNDIYTEAVEFYLEFRKQIQ